MISILLQLLPFLILITQEVCSVPKYDASQQIMALLDDQKLYDKDILPFQNISGPLMVSSTMFIRSIDIDDIKMRTNVELTFRMKWMDNRISYSAPVPYIRFSDASKFWIPDAFFRDSFRTELMKSIHPESFIQVSNNGTILYSSRFLVNLRCEMDLQRFPHDSQECKISFASYGYSTKDIIFQFQEENPLSYGKNMALTNRYSIGKISTGDCSSKTSTGEYSCLKVTLAIHRIFSGYLLEWYMPCISLVIIAFFSEFLDVSLLMPRLLLTVGPLLTLLAASLSYSHTFPSVPYSTALDVFTGISLLAIFATVLHVLIGHYYHKKPQEEKAEVIVDTSRWRVFYGNMKTNGNRIAKIGIISFYSIFVALYFLAYIL